jgi:hypothetical protein
VRIHGNLEMNRLNPKETGMVQNYKKELSVDFPSATINPLFNIEVQYFKDPQNKFSIVRMTTEISLNDLVAGGIKGFDDKLFMTITFQAFLANNISPN